MNTPSLPWIYATDATHIDEAINEKIALLPSYSDEEEPPSRDLIDHLLHLEAAARRRAAKRCQQDKRLFKRPSIPTVIIHTAEGWELVA